MCVLCLKKLSFALFGERFIGKFSHYSSSKSAKTRKQELKIKLAKTDKKKFVMSKRHRETGGKKRIETR